MNIGLFEDAGWRNLLPLVWLRPAHELFCGRDRLIDKVRRHCGAEVCRYWTRPSLRAAAVEHEPPAAPDSTSPWWLINSRAMITADLLPPAPGVAWKRGGVLLAAGVSAAEVARLPGDFFLDAARVESWMDGLASEPPPDGIREINYPWELIAANAGELRRQCREGGRHEGVVYSGVQFLSHKDIYIAPGAVIKSGVVLDAEHGPIHIDRGAVLQPTAVVEGPAYIGPRSIVRPGASIREGTSIGQLCKVGGEIEGSIIAGPSNKQHDGFLGHSYLGAWVNLGAGTITSDLKNTYGAIRVSLNGVNVETGQRFLGAIIGDHAKTAIGTLLPTGCIIGVAANVVSRGTAPRFIPSFSWMVDERIETYRVEKVIQIAETVMGRRDMTLTEAERTLLKDAAREAAALEKAGPPR